MDFQLCKEKKRQEWVESDEWLYNEKFDGERAFIFVKDYKIEKIITRKGINALPRYDEFKTIKFNIESGIIDSEIIAINGNGLSDFNLLALRSHLKDEEKIKERAKEIKVKIMAFDILEVNGLNITMKPLIERIKELQKAVIESELIEVVKYYDKFEPLWQEVIEKDKEGIIAKNKYSAYEGKRTWTWIKIKNWQEEVIEFDSYEMALSENGFVKGITLTNKEGIRCACLGEQHKEVKELLDKGQKVKVCVQYLNKTNDGKYRFISFKELKRKGTRGKMTSFTSHFSNLHKPCASLNNVRLK